MDVPSKQLPHIGHRGASLRVAIVAFGVFALGACASDDSPDAALQAADIAITHAEQNRVADYASPELAQARAKLAEAREAVNHEQMGRAAQLAEQSRVDAELATAKAEELKAKAVNDEMVKSTDAMKHEMQRNHGAGT